MAVHSASASSPAVASDFRARFERDGFAFPVRAFSAETAARYLDTYVRYESEGVVSDKEPLGKQYAVFPWVYELCVNPVILDHVEALIGPNILVMGARPWNKQPNDERFVSWHQDNAYFGLEPHDEVTIWAAITESDRGNGCLRYIPGSHTWGDQVHAERRDAVNMLSRGQTIEDLDDASAVDVELAPGEVAFHHERTVHGSKGNYSPRRRLGYSVFFIPTHVRSTVGRRGALLVRGVDEHGHWDRDPIARFDADPAGIELSRRNTRAYYAVERQQADAPG